MEVYRNKRTYKTELRDVDFKDELKISALLERFETSASDSADELGFGYEYLKAHGYAFFLAEIRCVLTRAVSLNEPLLIKTWPTPPSYAVFGREFEGYCGEEKVLCATSRWCAVDFATEKLLSPAAFPEQDYADSTVYDDTLSGAPKGKTARLLKEDGEEKFSLKIANSEYDHNLHVNNTRYADYCLNCFSVEELRRRKVKFFSFAYVKQCKEGDILHFYRKDDGEKSIIGGFNEAGENVVRAEIAFDFKAEE